MADYATTENAFLVASSPEPAFWPHDPRNIYRTLRRRLVFESLMKAFTDSYAVARRDPLRYAAMSEAAHETMRAHCSEAETIRRLRPILSLSPVREVALRPEALRPAPPASGLVGL